MKGENHILVIAIDKYLDNSFPTLNNAKFDAARFVKVLSDKYGFKTIQEPLFDDKANRTNTIEALNQLAADLNENDSIIIYFAGHGAMHANGKIGYWIPYDATKTSVSHYINNSTVIDYIKGIEAKHVLLISDSCFSGSFLSHSRGINHEARYSKLSEDKSRWLFTSGREETVLDGQPGKGSPFANSLIDFLEGNKSKFFSFTELAAQVIKDTADSAKQLPIFCPIVGVDHKGGQMVFALNEQIRKIKRGWEGNFKLFVESSNRPEWPFISKENPETKSLGIWCLEQRSFKRKGKLDPEREKKLLDAGFVFEPNDEKFYKGLGKFIAFMRKTGLNDVPKRLQKKYASEDAWHRVQQKWYAKAPCDPNNPKTYPLYRYEILVKEGIPLETAIREDMWKQFQLDLIKFYETNERLTTIPSQVDNDKAIANLGNRLNDHMVRWKKNELSPEQVKFLEQYVDINYKLNKAKREFEKQIEEYLNFRKLFPNEKPSKEERKRPEVKKVLDWKALIKHRFKGETSEKNKWRMDRLTEINFPWESKTKNTGFVEQERQPITDAQIKAGKQFEIWSY